MLNWLKKKLNEVWSSIFRVGWPRSEKEASVLMTESFLLHLHPVKTRKNVVSFWYTLRLGSLATLLFFILLVTGIFLMFYYVPSTGSAYQNMKDLEFVVSYGWLLRNLHRWSAHAMVIAVFLHMCRVFYTGSFKMPRQFNWIIGVILLLLTLFLSFTGYLLPWDQLAYWAITVGTSIATYVPLIGGRIRYFLLGGNIIGDAALVRFYVLHCLVLPLVAFGLIAYHFWRIRKDGGISGPPFEEAEILTETKERIFPASTKTYGLMALAKRENPLAVEKELRDSVPTWPALIFRSFLWGIFAFNLLLIISIFFNAPLEEMADPTNTPNPAKAPWYFLWLQELVHYSAFWGGVAVPFLALLFLIGIPYIFNDLKGVGRWFARERKVEIFIFTLFVISVVTLTIIGTYFRGPNWAWVWPWPR